MTNNLRDGILVGLGNPLLDFIATVDPKYLDKHELGQDNAILAEDKHKQIFIDLQEKYETEFMAGGSVQNSLRVCQWILKKPNATVFFGCVGKDNYANILETRARGDGVDVRYQFKNVETGKCACLITGKHRSLIADLSAANHFTENHILLEENYKILMSAEYYYISGFFLTVSPPTIMTVANMALERNKPFIMNLSAAFISQFFKEPLMNAMPYVDVIFGNEAEAVAFAKTQNIETEDLKEIGVKIQKLPKYNEARKRIVILTQATLPVLLFQDGKIKEFPVVELKESEILDTNGAGDSFVGGFLSQLVQGKSYDDCIRCGITAARIIIQRSGCSVGGVFELP